MLDITGNDINQLNDADLRSLIGQLCEAELRALGLPTASVTWGGHHNAGDGGLDVRVDLSNAISEDSFIPRSKTGFQVKKPDMPRNAILNEMRPKGILREVIEDLASDGGAYIIVSSQGSTSDSALKNRKQAMIEALGNCQNATKLKIEFYDRERIAGWVRSHPSLIIWVREKIGKIIHGWKGFSNWSNRSQKNEEEYIFDDYIRLYNSANQNSEGFSALEGINEIRRILHQASVSIRLVGLSGVGKTRLLQALFDERIGEKPLNKSQVFYADISDSPNPVPITMAEYLVTLRRPAILVIDNCPFDLHRRLTEICKTVGNLVGLITVEYDIRDDQPEETEVFRLEPSSEELIRKLILSRYNHISDIDARSIASFSGGNARIALSLARTIHRGENLGHLRDEDLFSRLFEQRHKTSDALLKAAEVCSLVYSFNCQTGEKDIELRQLSSLCGMSVHDLFRHVSELKRRDLVQQRGVWRAVLPQAIANKLARRALESIPINELISVFLEGRERLLKSFSRRLSFLHECQAATQIAETWLSDGGIFGDVGCLNEFDISIICNLAPIQPELTLSTIERVLLKKDADSFFSRKNLYYNDFTRLLHSLAYDKDLFERSVNLLCRFALTENPKENYNSIRRRLKSLFYLKLSGTHATPEQRLKVIDKLIVSQIAEQVDLGIFLLDAALEAGRFSSSYSFEFGAHSRDYGYLPKNLEEVQQWYNLFINYVVSLATSDLCGSSNARILLAKKFRFLWLKAGMYDELEYAVKEISQKTYWKEAWGVIRTTIRLHEKGMIPQIASRLNHLESLLKPETLLDKVKLYAFSNQCLGIDLVDNIVSEQSFDAAYQKIIEITRTLGREVANNEKVFEELLPDLLSNNSVRLFEFGQGLADACSNPTKVWQQFRKQLSLLEETNKNYQVTCGFLNVLSEIDSNTSEELLDEAVTDDIFAKAFPKLQANVVISLKGIKRLYQSLDYKVAPIEEYEHVAYAYQMEDIHLCELLRNIALKPNGLNVSINILHMRYNKDFDEEKLNSEIIAIGQELIIGYSYTDADNSSTMDFKLSEIIKKSFISKEADGVTRILCEKLVNAYTNYGYMISFDYILETLAKIQPMIFLDAFLGDDINSTEWSYYDAIQNAISKVDDEIIINWCEINPIIRYPSVASSLIPYWYNEDEKLLKWTDLAIKMINNCSNPIDVLDKFSSILMPTSWSGSLAEIMQARLDLVLDLKQHKNPVVMKWAHEKELEIVESIRLEREQELMHEKIKNERFE